MDKQMWVVVTGAGPHAVAYSIRRGQRYVIGRAEDCDIYVPHWSVSRHHAGGWLGSSLRAPIRIKLRVSPVLADSLTQPVTRPHVSNSFSDAIGTAVATLGDSATTRSYA